MQPTPQQNQYLLSEDRNQAIFEKSILTSILPFSLVSSRPGAVFLGGQPGSGKSNLARYHLSKFENSERAIVVNSDALREFHPAFASLQRTNVNQASFLVNPDTIKWQQKLIAAAIETKRNILLDGTLGGHPAPIQATIQLLQKVGYWLQISILAIPARLSRFGIYKRYENQVALKGSGRWVGMDNHDRLYNEIPNTLALLETENSNNRPTVDQIQIYTRLTEAEIPALLYDNQVNDGHWQQPPTAVDALRKGRDRPWTPEEQNAFLIAVEAVAGQMRQRGVSQEDMASFYHYVELPH